MIKALRILGHAVISLVCGLILVRLTRSFDTSQIATGVVLLIDGFIAFLIGLAVCGF